MGCSPASIHPSTMMWDVAGSSCRQPHRDRQQRAARRRRYVRLEGAIDTDRGDDGGQGRAENGGEVVAIDHELRIAVAIDIVDREVDAQFVVAALDDVVGATEVQPVVGRDMAAVVLALAPYQGVVEHIDLLHGGIGDARCQYELCTDVPALGEVGGEDDIEVVLALVGGGVDIVL